MRSSPSERSASDRRLTASEPGPVAVERRAGASRSRLFETIIEEAFSEIYILDVETLRFLLVNKSARRNLGYSSEELHALSAADIKAELTEADLRALLRPLTEDKIAESVIHTRHRRRNGTFYPVEVHSRLSTLDGRAVLFQLVVDQTELKHIDARARLLADIETAASKSKSSEAFIDGVLRQLCDHWRWNIGHACQWREDLDAFTSSRLWRFRSDARWHEGFRQITESMRFASSEGLAGQVHLNGAQVFISHVTAANFPQRGLMPGLPIRQAFAMPLFVGNNVSAVLELFSDNPDVPAHIPSGDDEQIGLHINRLYALKRAEEDFGDIRERFEIASRSANLGMWDYNFRTRAFALSRPSLDLLGLDSDQPPRTWEDFFNLLHGDDVQTVRDAFTAHIVHRAPFEADFRMRLPDGAVRWLHMRGDGAWDSAGNILGSAGAITNVTARKEEQLFRGDFAVLVASGMSSEEKISAVLDRACSYFGLPTAVVCHVAGDECRTLYSTGPAAPRHGSTTSVAQAIYATSFRVEGVHAFAEIANSPLADHPDRVACAAECYLGAPVFVNGARYGTICFLDSRPRLAPFQDINIAILRTIVLWLGDEIGRAQYVAEMTESDLRNSAHLASVGDAVLTLNELGCVEDSNPAAGALFGMTSEHLRGVSLLQLLPGAQALTGPDGRFTSVRGREEIVVRSDGSPVPVLMQLSEVHLSDRRIYTVALSDLTATKQAEIAKREFVSVVSHELRTPLTSICGALSLISAQTSGPLTDATIELVDIARRNGDRLVRLVNDILDVEKLETGKFEMSLGPIDLGAALTDAISANTSYAARFNVDFRLSGDVHLPYVMADANRLAQVMANLMSNAAKFTRPNTSVEIRAKANGQFARIEIQDCGHGIPDSLKPHLFEKFRQGDHSNTREREGSGLGLNISRQLVDLMHGEIGFFSEAGVGTTFYVDLPLANAAAPGGAHAHAATSTEGFSI